MFFNIGRSIKAVTKTFCYLGIALSILLGLILLATGSVLIGLLVALLGSILSWMSSLLSYGFGQLIENSDVQQSMLEKQLELLRSMSNTQSAQPQGEKGAVPVQANPAKPTVNTECKVIPASDSAPREAIIFPHRIDGLITCPKCGERQRGNRNLCQACEIPFRYESENISAN